MPYNFQEIKKRLIRIGYKIVRQKGSHVVFSNGEKTLPVPNHGGKDISPGVEKKIIEITGFSKEQFKDL